MADILVNTAKLNHYEQRISAVNARITRLDYRLDRLYSKVGLLGLWDLIQADALMGYNKKLTACKNYLKQTAVDFEKIEKMLEKEDPLTFQPKTNVIVEAANAYGKVVKKRAQTVKKIIQSAADSYYSGGTVYKLVQYGNVIMRAGKGVSKIVGGITGLFATAGGSVPVSLVMIASGINDIINVDKDLNHITNGDYEKVGTEDALRDLFVKSGAIVGEALGNKKLGENIGRVWYNGMDLVLTLNSLDKTINAFGKNTVPTDHTLKQEVNGLLKADVSTLFNTDVGVLAKNYPGIKNFALNALGAIDIADKANSVIATGEKSIKVLLPDYKPQASNLSSFFDTFGKVQKGGTNIAKITKFIFG